MSRFYRTASLCVLILSPLIFVGTATADITERIAISGESAPSGDGSFATFELPRLADSGRVAFIAGLFGTPSSEGIFWEEFPEYSGSVINPYLKSLSEVVRVGQESIDGDGVYGGFSSIAFVESPRNEFRGDEKAAFNVSFSGSASTQGIAVQAQGTLAIVAREGQGIPFDTEGKTFSNFSSPVVREVCCGGSSFQADSVDLTSSGRTGVYEGSASSLYEKVGDQFYAPTLAGNLMNIGQPAIGIDSTNHWQFDVFRADISDPDPDGGETQGILVNGPSGLTIVDTNTPTGTTEFGQPIVGGSGGSYKKTVVDGATMHSIQAWLNIDGTPTPIGPIAATGIASPDGNGIFDDFSNPAGSNPTDNDPFGLAVFRATLTGTLGGAADDQGIFKSDEFGLSAVLRSGDVVPGESVNFESLGAPTVNDLGVILFSSEIGNGLGGQLEAAFITDGNAFGTVVKQGESRDGSVITSISFIDQGDIGGVQGFNNFGQVAYRADLADGRQGVYLFTPTLEFAQTASGDWNDAANWSFGLLPGEPHSVFIAPDASTGSTVVDYTLRSSGPRRAVNNLTIEPSGAATAELNFRSEDDGGSAIFNVHNILTVGANSQVTVNDRARVFVDTLNLQGGVVQGDHMAASDFDAIIYARRVEGFGNARDIFLMDDDFLATLADSAIDAQAGLLDVVLSDNELVGTQVTVGVGSTLVLGARSGERVIFDSVDAELLGGILSLPDGLELDEGARLHGFGSVSGRVLGDFDSLIEAHGGNFTVGDTSDFNGFRTDGDIVVRAGATINLENKVGPAPIGRLTLLEGGTLESATGVFLAGGNVINGNGNINSAVAAQIGSTIVADGAFELGDSTALNGFFSDGFLSVNDNTVTLNDANRAVVGSLTEIGNAAGPGTLGAPNGVLVEFGKNISGYGAVAGAILNNGFINGVGPDVADFLDLQGLVTGVGAFGGTVAFSGGFSPGLSPTETEVENAIFISALEIEIGGLIAGDEFDKISASGFAILGGTLQITLIDSFAPDLGDEFIFLSTVGGITGAFTTFDFPTFGGLTFELFVGDDFAKLTAIHAVPLPAGVWLFVSGLAVLGGTGRSR